jgi:acetylornithine deacetylase/succinyl-diaminopimelate desuccinylase-like protein
MDTVFQPGLKIKATIRDGRVYAPGIGDDTRNIEALLGTIRALDNAKIKTKGDDLLFTTDEEAGMTGAKSYTKENKNSITTSPMAATKALHAGIGINWYRHHFIGPVDTRAHARRPTLHYVGGQLHGSMT